MLSLILERAEGVDAQKLQYHLYHAAWHGNIPAIQVMVDVIGVKFPTKGNDSGYYDNVIFAAASEGHLETVKHLIKLGADEDLQLTHGNMFTALHIAAKKGFRDIVRYLISAGADCTKRSSIGYPYELGCFDVFWEAGYPAHPRIVSDPFDLDSIRFSFLDVQFLEEVDSENAAIFAVKYLSFFDSLKPNNNKNNISVNNALDIFRFIRCNFGQVDQRGVKSAFEWGVHTNNVDMVVALAETESFQSDTVDELRAGTVYNPFNYSFGFELPWHATISQAYWYCLRNQRFEMFKLIVQLTKWDVQRWLDLLHNCQHRPVLHELLSGAMIKYPIKQPKWKAYKPREVDRAVSTLRFILEELGISVNSRDKAMVTPLMEAVKRNAPIVILQQLMSSGASVTLRSILDETVTHVC